MSARVGRMNSTARIRRRVAGSAAVRRTGACRAAGRAPPATAQPTAAPPIGADLSSLTYSATSNLSATLLSPAAGAASTGIATKILVSTVSGAGVELRVNGKVISAKQIGMRSVNKKTGETRYEYYGVVLDAGPNTVEVTPLGAR